MVVIVTVLSVTFEQFSFTAALNAVLTSSIRRRFLLTPDGSVPVKPQPLSGAVRTLTPVQSVRHTSYYSRLSTARFDCRTYIALVQYSAERAPVVVVVVVFFF